MYKIKVPCEQYLNATLRAGKNAGFEGALILLIRPKYDLSNNILKNEWANIDDLTHDDILILICGQSSNALKKPIYIDESSGLGGYSEYISMVNNHHQLKKQFNDTTQTYLKEFANYIPNINQQNERTVFNSHGVTDIRRVLNIEEKDLPAILLLSFYNQKETLISLSEFEEEDCIKIIKELVNNLNDVNYNYKKLNYCNTQIITKIKDFSKVSAHVDTISANVNTILELLKKYEFLSQEFGNQRTDILTKYEKIYRNLCSIEWEIKRKLWKTNIIEDLIEFNQLCSAKVIEVDIKYNDNLRFITEYLELEKEIETIKIKEIPFIDLLNKITHAEFEIEKRKKKSNKQNRNLYLASVRLKSIIQDFPVTIKNCGFDLIEFLSTSKVDNKWSKKEIFSKLKIIEEYLVNIRKNNNKPNKLIQHLVSLITCKFNSTYSNINSFVMNKNTYQIEYDENFKKEHAKLKKRKKEIEQRQAVLLPLLTIFIEILQKHHKNNIASLEQQKRIYEFEKEQILPKYKDSINDLKKIIETYIHSFETEKENNESELKALRKYMQSNLQNAINKVVKRFNLEKINSLTHPKKVINREHYKIRYINQVTKEKSILSINLFKGANVQQNFTNLNECQFNSADRIDSIDFKTQNGISENLLKELKVEYKKITPEQHKQLKEHLSSVSNESDKQNFKNFVLSFLPILSSLSAAAIWDFFKFMYIL